MRLARALPVLVALLAAGCGGAGRARVGALSVRVVWPGSSARVIPSAAQSIVVQVLQGAAVVDQATLTPSAPQTSFTEVPLGSVTVKAVAYPTIGGTGTLMATASVAQTVASGSPATVALTMASTIDHLTIAPSPINLAMLGLLTQQLTVTAYDASNAVVLTAPSDLTYATTNSLLFNVSATGLVQGLAVGTATVTATDAISGKSATATVHITLN